MSKVDQVCQKWTKYAKSGLSYLTSEANYIQTIPRFNRLKETL